MSFVCHHNLAYNANFGQHASGKMLKITCDLPWWVIVKAILPSGQCSSPSDVCHNCSLSTRPWEPEIMYQQHSMKAHHRHWHQRLQSVASHPHFCPKQCEDHQLSKIHPCPAHQCIFYIRANMFHNWVSMLSTQFACRIVVIWTHIRAAKNDQLLLQCDLVGGFICISRSSPDRVIEQCKLLLYMTNIAENALHIQMSLSTKRSAQSLHHGCLILWTDSWQCVEDFEWLTWEMMGEVLRVCMMIFYNFGETNQFVSRELNAWHEKWWSIQRWIVSWITLSSESKVRCLSEWRTWSQIVACLH